MANYCNDCKFAGSSSGGQIYCNHHSRWMDKWASCTDYIWRGRVPEFPPLTEDVSSRVVSEDEGNAPLLAEEETTAFNRQIE